MESFRIWWPKHFVPGGSSVLAGWINVSGRCIDIVVASATITSELHDQHVEGFCEGLRVLGRSDGEFETESLRVGFSYEQAANFYVPKVEHLEFEGKILTPKVHIILYEPRLRAHHFSAEPWDFFPSLSKLPASKQEHHPDKPYWLKDNGSNEANSGLERVFEQLNCAGSLHTKATDNHSSFRIATCLRTLAAGALALISTLYFLAGQLGWLVSLPVIGNVLRASTTFRILNTRFQELTSLPMVLSEASGHQNAHRLSMLKQSAWLKIAVDFLLGAVFGGLILWFGSSIAQSLFDTGNVFTDNVLRTGCIWLMGVPAGFKLNNELAEVLGTAALNVTQAFSTLSVYLLPDRGSLLICLALVSVLLGGTASAAVLVDMFFLATAHIAFLQRAAAFIYGNQLKLLAALWRMFRGRKHNPLRNRIDSNEYSVEQLVVASLMFTPLLLLLPTTSVFYTFFTILYISVSVPRFLLQSVVAGLGLFPYVETWLWLVARNRLPSGVEFRVEDTENSEALVATLNSTAKAGSLC